jgi:ATP-dependent Clp protease, protease subunit
MFGENEFRKYAINHIGMNSNTLDDYNRKATSKVGDILGFTPAVIEERQLNVAQMDVFSRLMMDRIIFLGVGIDSYVGNVVTAQLLFLESTDPKRDITMFINSPGGSVYAGLGMYDTMQYVAPDIATICTGMAASMGAVLMCSGVKGKRSALPHARVMIHQPSGGAEGQSRDMEITMKEMIRLREELYKIIAEHSGQTFEKVEADSDRDYWMRAEEAKAYGMVDEVLSRNSKA